MKHSALGSTGLAAAVVLGLGTVVPHLFAQTGPQPNDDSVEFSTWPGPSDAAEPEGEIDPKDLDYPTTLGQSMLPSEEDPALQSDALTKPDDGLIYPLGLMASSKTLGADVSESVRAELSSNAHYFSSTSANGAAVVLVGVSADNACHFNFTGTGQCSYGPSGANYRLFLDDLVAQGLNVIRLWVSIVGGDTASPPTQTTCPGRAPQSIAFSPLIANHPELRDTDNPFVYDPSHGTPNGVGRWWLDSRNGQFFSRLAAVVKYANSNNIVVEVTLFSPLTGNIGIGPYGVGHAYKSDGTALTGFTDTENFVNIDSVQYAVMKTYLFNVIHWTVDALYQYPNVYFEVANEPENVRLGTTNTGGCGNNSEEAPNSPNVAKWQNTMANELRSYEARYLAPAGPLAHTHLVAVEPSTVAVSPPSTTFAGAFVSGGAYSTAGNVVNSHYTLISPKGTPTVQNPLSQFGLGAVKMMRMYSSQPKIFGFNETKITGGIGGACGGGGTGGSVAAGRAEAWEFLVNQGGVYNAFGYDCSGAHNCSLAANLGDPYCQIRIQMGVLQRFLTDSMVNIVTRTKASAPVDTGVPTTSGTNWINLGPYDFQEAASKKYWAAFEPTGSAMNRRWLAYIHHSNRSPTIDGGYTAVTTTRGYREANLSVCLIGAGAGDYYVRWYKNPESAVASAPSHKDSIHWSAPTSCTPGGPNSISLERDLTYDYRYDYDVAILISNQP